MTTITIAVITTTTIHHFSSGKFKNLVSGLRPGFGLSLPMSKLPH
jgi:hypothetical protein